MRDLLTPNFTYPSGQPAAGADVEVLVRGQETLAPLYSALVGSSQLSNPLRANSVGSVWFYIEPGAYDYRVNGVRVPFDAVADSGAARYVHTQTAPASTWTVEHGMTYPVQPLILLDSENGSPVQTDTKHYPETGTTVLTFPAPASGRAYF